MKKIVSICCALFLLLGMTMAQEPQTSFELKSQISSSKTYVARDFIKLMPGFSFKPTSGQEFKATIDKLLMLSPQSSLVGGDDGVTGTSKFVGSIEGSLDVQATGASTYTMPIKVAPGTAGMTPELSIVYNSQSGNGLLGQGFALQGLSSITRLPRNYHKDDELTSIDFVNDKFALDGNRLIAVSGTYGANGTEYRTENNVFAKIISYGTAGGGPQKFIVYTKSGLIKEYGYTADSRIEAQGKSVVFSWQLNKVSDTKGNYFTVSYYEDNANGEFRPLRIDYTGNNHAELDTYASVQFKYTSSERGSSDRRNDKVVSYVNGVKQQVGERLVAIESYYGSTNIWKYTLKYESADVSKVQSIQLFNKNGEAYNPTKFGYNNSSDFRTYKRVGSIPLQDQTNTTTRRTNVQGTDAESLRYLTYSSKIYTGDFNGDGIDDVVTIADKDKGATWTGLKLFLGKKDGTGLSYTSFNNLNNTGCYDDGCKLKELYIGDFNGDGKSDILLRHDKSVNTLVKLYSSTYVIMESHGSGFTMPNFEHLVVPYIDLSDYRASKPILGDFDGDGRSDIFYVYDDDTEMKGFLFLNNGSGLSVSKEINLHKDYSLFDAGDFNGDGCTDVMYRGKDGCDIVTFDRHSKSLIKSYSNSFPNENDFLVFGDFNGDRITDFVKIPPGTRTDGGPWSVYYNTGGDFVQKRTNLYLISGFINPDESREEFAEINNQEELGACVGDFNSDGLADIMLNVRYKYGTGSAIVVCYSDRNLGLLKGVIEDSRYHSESRFVLGDFNGNGIFDMLSVDTKSPYWEGYRLTYLSRKVPELVTNITNGYGEKINLEYEPLTNDNVYTKSSKGYTYPLIDIQAPYFVVSNVKSEDGHGGYRTTNYSYKGLKAHVLGGGILGFDEYTVTDVEENRVTTTSFDFDKTHLIPYTTGSVTKVNGTTISQSVANNAVYKDAHGVLFHYVTSSTQKEWDLNGSITSDVANTYTYDKTYGNLLTMKVVQGAASNYFTTTTTNTYGNNASKWHLGRLTYVTVDKKITGKPTHTNKSQFMYDLNSGLLTKEIVQPGDAKYTLTKSYKHDVFGNIKETTITGQGIDAIINKSTYDPKGRYIEYSTDAMGYVIKKEYNAHDGSVSRITDPNGLVSVYTYDGFGQLTKTQNPDGTIVTNTRRWVNSESNAPTGIGRKAFYSDYTEASGSPGVTTYYDKFGRTLRTVTKGFGNKTILADTWYNKDGTVQQVSSPYYAGSNSVTTTYEYDALKRVIKETLPDGNYTTTAYNGLVTSMTDAMGYTTKREVDALGKLIKSTDAYGKSVSYEYNSQALCVKVTDPKGNVIETGFDIMGNRTKLIDPDLGTIDYDYNCLGQLKTQTDALGNESSFVYDLLGRMISRTEKEGTTSWTYATEKPMIGLLLTESGPGNISVAYNYDGYGRLLEKKETLDTELLTTAFAYDQYGRVTKTTYPSGYYTTNHYNEQGMLVKVSDSKNKTHWTLQDLSASGQVKAFALGNGLTTSQEYDPLRRWLKNYKVKRGSTLINGMEYGYNAVANLKSRKTYALPSRAVIEETFDYDKLHRLTESVIGSEVVTVNYDEMGNITYKSDVGTYVYGYGSRIPHAVTKVTDHMGRTSLDQMDIQYSSFHKVTRMQEGNNTMEIIYGPAHMRKIAKYYTGGTAPMVRYYAGGLFEREKNNGKTKDIHYIMTGSGCVAIYTTETGEDDKLTYLHKDHLGSIAAISNAAGDIIEEYSYDPWGKRRDPQNWTAWDAGVVVGEKRGFTGHEHLDMFSLINMNGRIYDPVLGRFLSADPFVQMPDHTQGLNRYTYCLNNPLNMTDPSGYSWLSNAWKSIVTAAVAIVVTVAFPPAMAVIAGFAGGFAGGFSGALLNGGNLGQALRAGIIGGVTGAFSAGAAKSIGNAFDSANFIGKELARAAAHGSVGGLASMAQGGKFEHGFYSGAFSSYAGSGMQAIGIESKGGLVVASAVVGGTASALGGGKFANGAVTGAFTMWFNHLAHPQEPLKSIELEESSFDNVKGPEFTGSFWDWMNKINCGGQRKWTDPKTGWTYYINDAGEIQGLYPKTGSPTFVGGPLKKGQSAIKLGKYLFNPKAFHLIKRDVLKYANPTNFKHLVGHNPDIMFKGGKIWLTGTKTGGYFGKSYETGLSIVDFLKLF